MLWTVIPISISASVSLGVISHVCLSRLSDNFWAGAGLSITFIPFSEAVTAEYSTVLIGISSCKRRISNLPVSKIFETGKFEILLLQLEIPISTVEYSAVTASENGIKVILNPAPAQKLSDNLLKHTWLITPNETEAEILIGITVHNISTAENAASFLQKKGVENVIIMMGASGAYIKSESFTGMVPGVKVKAVDTTAAGDVFNGALAVALARAKIWKRQWLLPT